MTDGLKPYSEYQPSGLPWCPTIPAHWAIRRNGGLFSQRVDTGHAHLPILEVSLRTGVRVRDMASGSRKQVLTQRENYKRAARGDIAYNMMRMWQGAVGVTPVDGLISPAYVVARPLEGTLSSYYSHLFRMDLYMQEVNKYSRGIVSDRNRLYWVDFKQMPSLLPPLQEQKLIVAYVRSLRRKVGAVVRAKRRLIELLAEQKQHVVQNSVTHGLDATEPQRYSGVDWIGNVPQDWTVTALRNRYQQRLGKMLDHSKITGKWLVPYLRNSDVQWDAINTSSLPSIDVRPGERSEYLLSPGDLLVCEGGNVGRAAIWEGPINICSYQKALHRLRPKNPDSDNPRFMMYTLMAASGAGAFMDGQVSTIPHLTGEKLRAHKFPFPSFSEQASIVSFIDEETGVLEAAIKRAEYEISLIQEYQTRLTADVVTGKLDVRAAAAALPDEDPDDLDLTAAYDADEDGLNVELDDGDPTEESM